MELAHLKRYAISMLGKPYLWGGDDPIGGFDCSGFASELLRAHGLVPYNYRGRARDIYALLKDKGASREAGLGAFVFYGKHDKEITHVAFALDSETIIEAGGGESTTLTLDAAINRNAFVRMRPILYRKDLLGALMLPEFQRVQQ